MDITDIRIYVNTGNNSEKLKAFASISFNNTFVVHDIRIINGNGSRLYVAFPAKKGKDGTYRDICHPITQEFRAEVEEKIIAAYNEKREQIAEAIAIDDAEAAD